ncbi:MAG: cupin [Bacteroidetes bacterium]|nr:MAG: cupin [Bacteroidota bacterium]
MEIIRGNIFIDNGIKNEGEESFETLFTSENALIEKIITYGKIATPGNWYDQDKDEWVLLIQGEATLEFTNNQLIKLKKGDYLFIPAHVKHRLLITSKKPNCIWLAIHGKHKNAH